MLGRRGHGRLYADQVYHHQALRALNHAAAQGADITEVLEATSRVRAGDARGWYAAWQALGDRNLERAEATADRQSRGGAFLRAHTYYLRSEFFLPPDAAERKASFDRNRAAFYRGLDTLAIPYERIAIPFDGHELRALYYPPAQPARRTLLVFCGGSDTTLEELYFFLVAAARARSYPVLTYEGPGQGAVLREQGVRCTPAWERPGAAVLDAFLAAHDRPASIVLVGLSLGGYLAARHAAFDERVDGVVSYDVFFDGGPIGRRNIPRLAYLLRRLGLEALVNLASRAWAAVSPAIATDLLIGGWLLGQTKPLAIADALAAYTLEGVADRIRADVLALAGTDDQFVPRDQIDRYARALVNARSVTARVYDRASGGAEHSQLGASTLWQADLFDWLERFGAGA